MSRIDRQMVYAPDTLVKEARDQGMTNLSGFVREALKEYVKSRGNAAKQNTSTTATSKGGANNV